MPFVSSDPDAWMCPYYEAIAGHEGFALLSIPIQFAALIDAMAVDHPAKGAKLREIDDLPSQRALLRSFTPSARSKWDAVIPLRHTRPSLPTGTPRFPETQRFAPSTLQSASSAWAGGRSFEPPRTAAI